MRPRRRRNSGLIAPGAEPLERRVLLSHSIAPHPFDNQPAGAPGTVEFENYDTGGEGVSFHNPNGGGPDIEPVTDAGGGSSVQSTIPGEWLNYTINAASTTVYSFGLRVACGGNGGAVHVEVDGQNATGQIQIANTGSWQTWTTINVPNISVSAGQHVLTLVIDSAANPGQSVGSFNWMEIDDNPAISPRTLWWRQAQFGMFIHWGLYSQLAGHWNGQTTSGFGEWIMNDLHIPLDQYAQVANQFDPTQFSAHQWVQTAESAGMKYVVMTAKHHDGFSMFDTSVNTYNVVDATPWHQDPIALLSQATHAAGLHFGAYYSILNWADPNASATGINTYMVTMETQLKELIQNDHPDLLWFDGEWPDWWTDERGRELTEFVRNLDPSIIINDRVGKRLVTDGDYDTPEGVIPTNEPAGRLWETAMTLNDTWGYKDTDNDWKSASTILADLQQMKSEGGNFLLNVGPTGAGVIPAPAVQILQQVGAALGVNTGTGGGSNSGGNSGGGSGAGSGSGSNNGTGSGGGTGTGSGSGTNTGAGSGSGTGTSMGTGVSTPPAPSRVINFSAGHRAIYGDAAGHRIVVTLRGPGSGQIEFATTAAADPTAIAVTGADARSSLFITGMTAVGDISVSGSLSALLAGGVDLSGGLSASGSIGEIQLRSAAAGKTIAAQSIGSLSVRGNLSEEIQATSIGRITAGGALSGADIRALSAIRTILVSSAVNSTIFAGVRSGLNALPSAATDLLNASASIGSVSVRGRGGFSNTRIAAGNIELASLGDVHPGNAASPFGLAADHIRFLTATVSGKRTVFRNLTATVPLGGDATARIL
jgi:alpha-L-fucosidase